MAISLDNPVVTHKITGKKTGNTYLLCVTGDVYRWRTTSTGWNPNVFNNFSEYLTDDTWEVEKINQFRGNV